MKQPIAKLRSIAYLEAAAILQADMDDADLECEKTLDEESSNFVREFIRNNIAWLLVEKGRRG